MTNTNAWLARSVPFPSCDPDGLGSTISEGGDGLTLGAGSGRGWDCENLLFLSFLFQVPTLLSQIYREWARFSRVLHEPHTSTRTSKRKAQPFEIVVRHHMPLVRFSAGVKLRFS